MIYYNQKYVFKRMCSTFRKKYLKYQGPYHLRILEKAMVMPARGYNQVPIFYVETDDGLHHGMLEVTPKEYKKYKVGEYFGRGGIIRYTQKDGCYYISKYDDAGLAIRKAVNSSRIRFTFLAMVLLLFIVTLILMALPLFR